MRIATLAPVVLAACSSARASEPLPTPPPGSGIELRADGDGTLVIDTVGGYEVHFDSHVDDVQLHDLEVRPGARRREVFVVGGLDHGMESLVVTRLEPGDLQGPGVEEAFEQGLLGGAFGTVGPVEHVTIAGHAGYARTGGHTSGGHPGQQRVAIVYTPEHQVMYSLMGFSGDGAPSGTADLAGRFMTGLRARVR